MSAREATSVLLYYHYVALNADEVKATKQAQLSLCKELDLMGRIRVTPEGLNGTLDGTDCNLRLYAERMDAFYGAGLIDWKWAAYPDRCSRRFTSVSVKIKDEVVGMVLSDEDRKAMLDAPGGKHLSAEEWHEALQQATDDSVVLLDVRNYYETRVGHFKYGGGEGQAEPKQAVDPFTRSFSDFKYFADKEAEGYKDKKVLMYCTGGVRCERASQYLKSKGVSDVYQLYGGIHAYQERYPRGFFKGKNFVYDPRVAVSAADVEETAGKGNGAKGQGNGERACELLSVFRWMDWRSLVCTPADTSDGGVLPRAAGAGGDEQGEEVEVVGRCMICCAPHDEYHSPYDRGAKAQTRCSYCRVLCLVCPSCKGDQSKASEIASLQCEMCQIQGREGKREA